MISRLKQTNAFIRNLKLIACHRHHFSGVFWLSQTVILKPGSAFLMRLLQFARFWAFIGIHVITRDAKPSHWFGFETLILLQ